MITRTAEGDLDTLLERFPQEPMAVIVIGRNGAVRVWLDREITTPEQFDWVARHAEQAATIARTMEPGSGIA